MLLEPTAERASKVARAYRQSRRRLFPSTPHLLNTSVNTFTALLNAEQSERLRGLLRERGFTFAEKPYTLFFAQKEKLSVAVYEKGPKVLVQGRGAEDIENLLVRRPDCPRSLSDKFADARVIENALMSHGKRIKIDQRTRAETDVAVAAASIVAREVFINWLDRKSKELGVRLGRGVSEAIKTTAATIVDK